MINKKKSGINVLMVTPRYFPYMGGIETHVHEVGWRLSAKGINVTLLTTVAHHDLLSLPKTEQIEGINILRVPAWPRQHDYYFAPEVYSIVKKGGWDIVHCQGCHTLVPPLAMLAARSAHIPYMLTFHTGGHSLNWRNRIRGTQWQLLRPLFRDAKKLVSVSLFEANYFRDMLGIPANRFVVIPNGAVIPNIPSDRLASTSSSLIISAGRLERYKGHHRLIAALPKIREKCTDARLLILGTGPYEAALRSLAREVGVAEYVEIRAIAANDRQAMAQQLSQAALVALLSEYEAHPVAIMESLALKRPVLVADTSGLHELAEQGLARAIPLESTSEQIATAVLEQMGVTFTLPSDFNLPTWDNCADQLQDLYYGVLGRAMACVS